MKVNDLISCFEGDPIVEGNTFIIFRRKYFKEALFSLEDVKNLPLLFKDFYVGKFWFSIERNALIIEYHL